MSFDHRSGQAFRRAAVDATSRGYVTLDGTTSTFASVEILGITEVAALLGVSRQRVDQLSHTDPDFPEPVTTLGRGRLWERKGIEKWARESGREVIR